MREKRQVMTGAMGKEGRVTRVNESECGGRDLQDGCKSVSTWVD